MDLEALKQTVLQYLTDLPAHLPAVNSTAVLAALIGGWITGSIWYGLAGQVWKSSVGKEGLGAFSPRRQIFTGLAQVIMTIMLANLMVRLGDTTMGGGVNTALIIWFGFVLTTVMVNYANLGARLSLTLVDSIHWLLVLVVMGAIIGIVSQSGIGGTAVTPTATTPPAASSTTTTTTTTGSGG